MPKYTRHQETGLLLHNHFGFVLDMGGGAFWVLEFWSVARAKHYLGQRVTVDGTRVGFNILDVDRMKLADEDWSSNPSWMRFFDRWWERRN